MTTLNPGLRFRDFIEALKQNNDLVEINEEVDPNLEVGAITRKCYEEELAAPLFNNLKGADMNLFKILGCPAGLTKSTENDHSRVALHLNLPASTPMSKIIRYLVDCKKKDVIPPHEIPASEAPCKENSLSGDEIDLDALPVPLLHKGDGGKYIQTYGMWCLQTPDGSWTNWSIARGQVTGKRNIAGLVMNPQHIRQVADKWAAIGKGREVPVCLCFGVPPAAILVSSMPIPDGATESEYIGALLGESLPVVKATTNDLMVPATSEIVLEGTLDLENLVPEGPFGEMHGYVFEGASHPCPTYTFNHMTYRNDAIMPISNPGLSTDETHTFIGGLTSAEVLSILEEAGVPVLEAFTPYQCQALVLALKIDLKKLRDLKTNPKDFSKWIGDLLLPHKPCFIIHEIILFGDDIDIFSFRDVAWAYATRHAPVYDMVEYSEVKAFALAPFVNQSDLMKKVQGGKSVTNCILHSQYEREVEFVRCDFSGYPEEIKDKVLSKWSTYGF
ncbi:hypothetical protein CANARDRAFT_54491 [[Candida] arabinofermentans NRRL YB-2248]|uniref:Ferulic acid decarboxylase 1 n=1 Tax=[Candida] arabinofermentans NRRL YB-2248 TaxID=983967 RepID=A0A1E4T849_9ASCO|nr:hypothetical protein CANARDRAFT_54491 [[Candida] arabinofermentans NRRL YB-2248]